jgi:hypothetical protein
MSARESIEQEIKALPREEALELQDWLAEYLDDREELAPEFVAAIERGKQDVQQGRVRL